MDDEPIEHAESVASRRPPYVPPRLHVLSGKDAEAGKAVNAFEGATPFGVARYGPS
jgi:hypothetical protein